MNNISSLFDLGYTQAEFKKDFGFILGVIAFATYSYIQQTDTPDWHTYFVFMKTWALPAIGAKMFGTYTAVNPNDPPKPPVPTQGKP